MSRALLITGATGKQGGAVIKALAAKSTDFHLLAITRNKKSPTAQRLFALSPKITLVEGDLDDSDALFKAAKAATSMPIWGVFGVQPTGSNKSGVATEERQGKDLVDSALKAGVKHFVYSSVDRHGDNSLNTPTNVPHFITKHHIEHHLIGASNGTDMAWTILRPVAFMENFDGGFTGKVFATIWKATNKSLPLQLVATEDIGTFAAKAFTDHSAFAGKAISLAGDELTYEQVEGVFKKKIGSAIPTTWAFVARVILWISKDVRTMFNFFAKPGYGADIKQVKGLHPELKDFETWLEKSVYTKK